MVKESIINLKKALSNSLQTVPNLIEVLKRGLDGIQEETETSTAYSTDEKVVGTWIDGTEIYEKTFNIGKLPNNTSKYYNHEITNIADIVGIEGIAISDTGAITIPNAGSLTVALQIAKASTIGVTTTSNLSDFTGYITLRYTKAAANRTPENDTKNDGDEEKNEEVKNEK